MKKLLYIPLFLISLSFGQDLGAFEDQLNYFYIFDGGRFNKVETLKIREYKIAKKLVAYINNVGQFKVWYDGRIRTLSETSPEQYLISDHLMAFNVGQIFYVYDNGRVQKMDNWYKEYFVNDSIAAWVDRLNVLKAYYNETTYEVSLQQVHDLTVGKNVITYFDQIEQSHVFSGGKKEILENFEVKELKVGMNLVAYIDFYDRFKIWHMGNRIDVDAYAPQSFQTGDNLAAWVGFDNQFMVFDDGLIIPLEFTKPDWYICKDHILAWSDNAGKFKIYFQGDVIELEGYTPPNIKMDNNLIAWTDYRNFLNCFYDGKTIKGADRQVKDFEVYLDVLISDVMRPKPQFFWNGKIFGAD